MTREVSQCFTTQTLLSDASDKNTKNTCYCGLHSQFHLFQQLVTGADMQVKICKHNESHIMNRQKTSYTNGQQPLK